MLEKFYKLWENRYLIILSIHILKLEISGCDREHGQLKRKGKSVVDIFDSDDHNFEWLFIYIYKVVRSCPGSEILPPVGVNYYTSSVSNVKIWLLTLIRLIRLVRRPSQTSLFIWLEAKSWISPILWLSHLDSKLDVILSLLFPFVLFLPFSTWSTSFLHILLFQTSSPKILRRLFFLKCFPIFSF
jgi:hypothetical protein